MKRCVFNQKGGVGKSTIAVNLAAIAAHQGRKTLLIDLDAQCNASRYLLGDDAKDISPSIADFFNDTLGYSFTQKNPISYVHETGFENLDIIPSSPTLTDLQSKLESRQKIYKLREMLGKLEQVYDEILIDTPPAYGFFSQVALMGVDRCLIPFDCDDFSREALYQLMRNIDEIRGDHNGDLAIDGIVVNQFQPRARLPQQLVNALRDEGLPVLDSKLSSSVAIRESHNQHMPMIHLDRNHKITSEFVALFAELTPS